MKSDRANIAARLVLPAAPVIAGAAASLSVGLSIGQCAVIAASLIVVRSLFDRASLPAHLMPLASLLAALVLPIGGVVLAAGIVALAGHPMGLVGLATVAGVSALASALAWHAAERLRAEATTRVAVIGSAPLADALAEELAADGIREIDMVGWIDGPPEDWDGSLPPVADIPLLGSLDRLRDIVIDNRIDLLVHGCAAAWSDEEEKTAISRLEIFDVVAGSCLDLPVRLVEATHFYEDRLGHVPLGTINSAWFQYIMHPRFRPGSGFSKRLMDLCLGVILSVLLAPVIALAAIAVKLSDGGPVLYRQRRLGAGGSEIEVMKLRSMSVSAEADGVAQWSTADDPRVTTVGRFLRRSHIDELPQLWNVLRGNMTLVGPRPERPEITPGLELEHVHYDRRHLVKPGITGWAQVRCGYGGSGTGTAWKLCHDLYYLKHRTAVLDLMIMVETLRVAARDAQFEMRAPDERFIVSTSPDAGRTPASTGA